MCQPTIKQNKSIAYRNSITAIVSNRSPIIDFLCFLIPSLFFGITNIYPVYLTGILRMICTHITLTLHYVFVDKDNYTSKLSQKQLERERKEYLVGIILHMWAQIFLQIIFPGIYILIYIKLNTLFITISS